MACDADGTAGMAVAAGADGTAGTAVAADVDGTAGMVVRLWLLAALAGDADGTAGMLYAGGCWCRRYCWYGNGCRCIGTAGTPAVAAGTVCTAGTAVAADVSVLLVRRWLSMRSALLVLRVQSVLLQRLVWR